MVIVKTIVITNHAIMNVCTNIHPTATCRMYNHDCSHNIPYYYKNNKKTFPIKMKEDVGMSKPKKHAKKVRWDPKLNKPLSYNPT